MFFHVHRLRRLGVVIPRHHIVRTEGEPGEFLLEERYDGETGRTVRLARLLPVPGLGQTGEVLPPLVDATVIYVKGDTWTVTGFERDAKGVAEPAYLQSWLMRAFSPQLAHEVKTGGLGPDLGEAF